ncbi:hypothetical protein Daus18300_008059 [Diaporthe australafricana]|uniref:Rhodopsin domain-containing protein n=1 Tax=Diaporthe australafricana TaxID=127596 RepID=A0ABR3WKA8_9PEZI
MSILAFYKRIFTLNIRWFKYCIYAMALYTTGWSVGTLFAVIFQCVPPSLFWTQYNPALSPQPTGFCGVEYPAFVVASSALNSVADVFIFALPLAMLWKLQLRRSQKFGLTFLFATGAFSIVASFVRLDGSRQAVKLDADATWIMADLYIWTLVEAGVALICSCLPVVAPIFSMVKDKITSYVSSKYSWSGSKESKQLELSSGFRNHAVGHRIDSETELRMNPDCIIRTDSFRMDTTPRRGDESSGNGKSTWQVNQNSTV